MKIKKIITNTVTVLAVGMAAVSGVMKLSGNPDVVKMLDTVGVGQYRMLLGIAEIAFAALFAFPKTMKIGFILLTAYFAGAMATEVSHHMMINALTPLVLIWIAAFLRNRYIFLPAHDQDNL
ncbi:DoxX family protein [Dyadobacter sp. CY107]|uniref:DoxX family protein n=1 Tax=Dyadobacter fanqingshengii TaxID=2906443 RepID=UPI001F18A70D|nr:DoxX family protein [Dyadobacter fanqingshengii]MCF2502022.1 DoxX family protein [Dyadobacter fanqingshengii]